MSSSGFGPDGPHAGFRFRVSIGGATISFQEVTGLEHEIEVETVKAGGENAFELRLPGRMKYNNLVFKRGHMSGGAGLWSRFSTRFSVGGGIMYPIIPLAASIELLDATGSPITTWNAVKAYPVKWNVSGLNAMDSKVLIETFELAHHGLKVS